MGSLVEPWPLRATGCPSEAALHQLSQNGHIPLRVEEGQFGPPLQSGKASGALFRV
jgi:hypothetical protein